MLLKPSVLETMLFDGGAPSLTVFIRYVCLGENHRHFTLEFLVGERLEDLKGSHLALETDSLIAEETMLHVYGKQTERQVRTEWCSQIMSVMHSLISAFLLDSMPG